MSHCSRRLDYITMVTQVDVNYHRSDSHHISIVLSAAASIAQMHSLLFASQISVSLPVDMASVSSSCVLASHGQHGSSQRTVMFESVACEFIPCSIHVHEKRRRVLVLFNVGKWQCTVWCPSPGASHVP